MDVELPFQVDVCLNGARLPSLLDDCLPPYHVDVHLPYLMVVVVLPHLAVVCLPHQLDNHVDVYLIQLLMLTCLSRYVLTFTVMMMRVAVA